MQPAAGQVPEATLLLEDLTAAMCRAQGPPQALVVAAAAVHDRMPSVAFVGLAVMAQDRQTIRYNTLRATQQGAARLGPVAAANCAAGLAIETKQVVHVRDVRQGDLGFHDLLYLQQEHQARACFVAPVVVAQNARGALSMAATEADAFRGQEAWLQLVAALCAPYVLLMHSHENLLALEGLVSQVLPMRVALQLQDQHRRSAALAPEAVVQQQLPLSAGGAAAAAAAAAAAGGIQSESLAGGAAAVPGTTAEVGVAAGYEVQMGSVGHGNTSLRQLRARLRLLRDQQQQQSQQQAGQSQSTAPPLQPTSQQTAAVKSNQLQHQQQAISGFGMLQVLPAFQQPRLELAYQLWVLQQGLRMLDSIFILLVLLSSFHGVFWRCLLALLHQLSHWQQQKPQPQQLSHEQLFDCAAGVALVLSCMWLLYQLRQQPARQYLSWRRIVVGVLRVLRTVLFCAEVWQLHNRLASSAQQHYHGHHMGKAAPPAWHAVHPVASSGVDGLGFGSKVQQAASGLLLMLGLLGQLPPALHAAVQTACLALVWATLAAVQVLQHGIAPRGAAGVYNRLGSGVDWLLLSSSSTWTAASWANPIVLLCMGLLLPAALVVAIDRCTRWHFLRKIS